MMIYAYFFEAKSIQSFIFSSGKLKDMVASSDLLDQLSGQILDSALLTIINDVTVVEQVKQQSPRCAAGACYLLFHDEVIARRFQNLWRVVVAKKLPTLEYTDALITPTQSSEDTQAAILDKGISALRVARNINTPNYPLASPITQRFSLTGDPASKYYPREDEWLDEKYYLARTSAHDTKSSNLESRFYHDHTAAGLAPIVWPNTFEASQTDKGIDKQFPMDGQQRVALIHIDGNDMGKWLHLIKTALDGDKSNHSFAVYQAFSKGVSAITEKAAQVASSELVKYASRKDNCQIMPARPLVLAGDDLTIIVRADIALNYTIKFLSIFEQYSQKFVAEFVSSYFLDKAASFPPKITACAGLVFMKPSQPFQQCHILADSLCKRAKTEAKARGDQKEDFTQLSALAFHDLKSTLIDDANTLFDRDLITSSGYQLGLRAYTANARVQNMPHIDDIINAAKLFTHQQLSSSQLEKFIKVVSVNESQAKLQYHQWFKSRDNSPKESKHKESLGLLKHTIATMLDLNNQQDSVESFPQHKKIGDLKHLPLADIKTLISIQVADKGDNNV